MKTVKKLWINATIVIYCLGVLSTELRGAGLILNEYNAVSSTNFLKDDKSDTQLGRIEGNGGNWLEFVVVEDHLDVRGWELRWAEQTEEDQVEAVWDPERLNFEQGIIRFTNHDSWSDLRSGTILTIGELETLVAEDGSEVVKGTDLSFNPEQEDWWIHIWSFDESLILTQTNVLGDGPGNFSVGDDNWELTVFNPEGEGTVIFGPIGEDFDDFRGGINNEEISKLETDPSPDVVLVDYNDGGSSTFGEGNIWSSGEEMQDFQKIRTWFGGGDPGNGSEGPALTIRLEKNPESDMAVVLLWKGEPGVEYDVLIGDFQSGEAWTPLASVSGTENNFFVDIFNQRLRFYRLEIK
ncbi:MAG TPA: hypothetical protein EYQ50_02065 [Verrucomicrobiales bacterium]|nr:hypothetical protein [Verrucomicrobiales bacterium]